MSDAETIRALTRRAVALRRHVVTVAAAQFAHLGGSMSCADLLAALFFDHLGPRDHFLLSKGHAVHALHACLVELGKIDAAELATCGQPGSRLGGHPTRRPPGGEVATGPPRAAAAGGGLPARLARPRSLGGGRDRPGRAAPPHRWADGRPAGGR